MSRKLRLSRRQCLNLMGFAGAGFVASRPIGLLLNQMVQGFIDRAKAQETGGVPPRNYVFLCLPGGPPRWTFDLPLQLSPDAPFMENPIVKTAFEIDAAGTLGGYSYKTHALDVNGRKIHLPYLWHSNVPAPGGGMRPMQDLAASMMFLRGCDLGIDGHLTNRVLQHRPNMAMPSLGGMVADASQAPLPAVGYAPVPQFVSKSGVAEIQVPIGGNSLARLFEPFVSARQGTFRANEAVKKEIEYASGVLQEYSLKNLPGADGLFRARKDAEALFMRELGNLAEAWDGLMAKYTDLIRRALGDFTVAGISDRPVMKSGVATDVEFTIQSATKPFPLLGFDIRTALQSAQHTAGITYLAESFAIAEFLLVRGLSSSVQIAGEGFQGIRHADGTLVGMEHDQHGTGTAAGLLFNSQYYRALSACLLAFIDTLKATKSGAGNLFDETVIHIAGEFSRSARDASGADHGFTANVVSLISGAIAGPCVSGNTFVNNLKGRTTGAYQGSWGVGAAMESLQGRAMNIGNVGSTIAELLRVEPPSPNDPSLLVPAGSKYTSVDEAKNVENA